ncbi:hypothetical protein HPB50_002201 [Hyalomma asiaticum]|uniref:Uncharacterized protein n=1 Tax=Hyalomma asiaticum TaxID=266040 RepID=A0ACB7RP12_HYAAI|nr:hypothetical protein HPB50_002201 [Hyalomma asiaticum]
MVSAMASRVSPRARLCRTAGVFFIDNLQCANSRDVVVRWKSWYTLYSACCLLTFALAELYFVANNTADSLFDFVLKGAMLLFNLLLFTYDMLHFIMLRPCCEVLIDYVRQQQDYLKSILAIGEKQIVGITAFATDLDRVRLNLSSIANLRRVLNSAWQFSIMASAVGLLVVACICIYSFFDDGVPTDQLLLTMSYCGYATIDFVDVARLSQTMANEVLKLKDSLMKITVFHDSPTQLRQERNSDLLGLTVPRHA